ncbi:MAG: radical SAM protein [Deltaproteobacteria bacterium]|nr:radical SAM protein [Deltaproteobacteria bacterium]
MTPLIIPIFIPHEGCPHRCVFCEQHKITDRQTRGVAPADVTDLLRQALASPRFDVKRCPEAAFYGGTFTGLSRARMKGLMDAVTPFMKEGLIRSMRVSTRPDALDAERLGLMKAYGVRTVELGVQSMDDHVLLESRRGHTARDTLRAVQALQGAGFQVGIQLMPGLPGDSPALFEKTVAAVLRLKPDMIRLYPAVVIRGTELARRYAEGTYEPMPLAEAVTLCRDATMRFEAEGIPVIRLGLHGSPSLTEAGALVAGPWHPAFGFLVRSAIHHRVIDPYLKRYGDTARIRLFVPNRDIPLVRGYKNRGIRLIERKTGADVLGVIADDRIPRGQIRVEVI